MRQGFRAVGQRPGLVIAEIAWRWAFGAAAWVLVLLAARIVLRAIPVSSAEIAMARRSGIFQAADAIARILVEAWPELLRATAVLLPGIAALWILAASLGRAATLNALLDGRAPRRGLGFSSLLGLHFLRAAATLAAIIGYFGAIVAGGMLLPPDPRYTALAVLIWLTVALLVAFCWTVINWFLSLAAIFIVRDGEATFAAVRSSLMLFRQQPSRYLGIATWFGLFRSGALVAAIVLSLVAAAMPNAVSAVVAVAVVALAYFAIADWLYIARLAAYLSLAEPEVGSEIPFEMPPLPEVSGAGECAPSGGDSGPVHDAPGEGAGASFID